MMWVEDTGTIKWQDVAPQKKKICWQAGVYQLIARWSIYEVLQSEQLKCRVFENLPYSASSSYLLEGRLLDPEDCQIDYQSSCCSPGRDLDHALDYLTLRAEL